MGQVQGMDSSSIIRTLLVDASGRAIVVGSGAGGAVEVVQDTPADLAPGIYGWDGSVWRKLSVDTSGRPLVIQYGLVSGQAHRQPMILGYSGDKTQEISELLSPGGTRVLTSDAVPAGEIWDVQVMFGLDVNSATTATSLRIHANGIVAAMVREAPTVANIPTLWNGHVVLSEGDTLDAQFLGVVVNDNLYFRYHAVVIDIDQ